MLGFKLIHIKKRGHLCQSILPEIIFRSKCQLQLQPPDSNPHNVHFYFSISRDRRYIFSNCNGVWGCFIPIWITDIVMTWKYRLSLPWHICYQLFLSHISRVTFIEFWFVSKWLTIGLHMACDMF